MPRIKIPAWYTFGKASIRSRKARKNPDQDATLVNQDSKVCLAFQNPDYDIELTSKSGIRFFVHKKNLSLGSDIFASMFEDATSETETQDERKPVLSLDDSTAALMDILPYFYNNRVPYWDVDIAADGESIRALDKYEIWRGIEAVEACFRNRIQSAREGERGEYELLFIYLFFCHFQIPHEFKIRNLNLFLNEISDVNGLIKQLKCGINGRGEQIPNFLVETYDVDELLTLIRARRLEVLESHAKVEPSVLTLIREGSLSLEAYDEWENLKEFLTSFQIRKWMKEDGVRVFAKHGDALRIKVKELVDIIRDLERIAPGP